MGSIFKKILNINPMLNHRNQFIFPCHTNQVSLRYGISNAFVIYRWQILFFFDKKYQFYFLAFTRKSFSCLIKDRPFISLFSFTISCHVLLRFHQYLAQ
jgi:hypothetical protein